MYVCSANRKPMVESKKQNKHSKDQADLSIIFNKVMIISDSSV